MGFAQGSSGRGVQTTGMRKAPLAVLLRYVIDGNPQASSTEA